MKEGEANDYSGDQILQALENQLKYRPNLKGLENTVILGFTNFI